MPHLNLSVPIANILLWLFTELFIVLATFQATRLYAQRHLHNLLRQGQQVPLSKSVLDSLPYNSDLQPLHGRPKALLTAARLLVIAVSVYLGAALDGTLRTDSVFEAEGAIALVGGGVTSNSGEDLAAMAKLSCLKIVNNNDVLLFKGVFGKHDILCMDGMATHERRVLIAAQIRSGVTIPERGEELKGLNVAKGKAEGLEVGDDFVKFTKGDESVRIVLLERLKHDQCAFGLRRSEGSDFEHAVELKVETSCSLTIGDFDRLLRDKPPCIPPRMSFLYQFIDATVVRVKTDVRLRRRGADVVAKLSTPGVVVGVVAATVATVACAVLWLVVRRGRVQDIMTARGVANLWGENKWGGRSVGELFLGWDGDSGGAYLGSSDGLEGGEGGRRVERAVFDEAVRRATALEREGELWEEGLG